MCPGTRACKRARQDSPGPGFALDKEFYGTPAPARFNMGVSGFSNCCSDSRMKDPGFIGTYDGFAAAVGGKGGGTPRPGRELASGLTQDRAVALARYVVAFYRGDVQAPCAPGRDHRPRSRRPGRTLRRSAAAPGPSLLRAGSGSRSAATLPPLGPPPDLVAGRRALFGTGPGAPAPSRGRRASRFQPGAGRKGPRIPAQT